MYFWVNRTFVSVYIFQFGLRFSFMHIINYAVALYKMGLIERVLFSIV